MRLAPKIGFNPLTCCRDEQTGFKAKKAVQKIEQPLLIKQKLN